MNSIDQLNGLGQSIWYDNIERKLLVNGELAQMIERGEIKGVTSNPSIFKNAIANSMDYDAALKPMAWSGLTAEQIFTQLAVEDIRAAADLFMPLFESTNGLDGYVSLEVSPFLAHDSEGTFQEALRLWNLVERKNLMVKIPATKAGLPAIRKAIAAGLNINVTLIFSIDRYAEVIDAYISGLEDRLADGKELSQIASVASFFVSRVDSKVDKYLAALEKQGGMVGDLYGKAAIANSKMAYDLFEDKFSSARFQELKAAGAVVQRPLWASTSTKNPNYRDVLYVEELIGPDTVNTMPPQTLIAFRDHGIARNSIKLDFNEAKMALDQLERLGISMKSVTQELEEEGVKAFADAFHDLLETIEKRRTLAINEINNLQPKVEKKNKQLEQDKLVDRIFAHDPTLWTNREAEKLEIRKRLNWLDAPVQSALLIPELNRFNAALKDKPFKRALLLGMGGSSLAPEVLSLILGKGDGGLDLRILDSTDPDQVKSAEEFAAIEDTLFIVSSKSGSTSEVNAFLEYFWDKVVKKCEEAAGDHFIAITDPGSSLEKIAKERNFFWIFNADPQVGGRFSALIAFGLVPAAVMGLDVNRILNEAQKMRAQCLPDVPYARNPALVLGSILGTAALSGINKLTILTDNPLTAFGSWLEQLIAESSGKSNKGIVPIDIEPEVDIASYSKDRLFIYLSLEDQRATQVNQLLAAGFPVITLKLNNPYAIAGEFYRWEFAIAAACSILKVNAFDQPDVQDSKTRTMKLISELQSGGKINEGKVIWENRLAKIYAEQLEGIESAKSLAEVLELFLSASRENDYIALNAYVARNPKNLMDLQMVRETILRRTKKATTLGFGPRFLHSTGQLHKGGVDQGLFIQITSENQTNLDIPGWNLSFENLELAQFLGDLSALQARGRRVMRVHLTQGKISDLI